MSNSDPNSKQTQHDNDKSHPSTISCPNKNTSKWNSHPRVYLQFGNSKKVTCPYCGTQYTNE